MCARTPLDLETGARLPTNTTLLVFIGQIYSENVKEKHTIEQSKLIWSQKPMKPPLICTLFRKLKLIIRIRVDFERFLAIKFEFDSRTCLVKGGSEEVRKW